MASLAVAVICLTLGVISSLETRHISVTHGQPLDWSIVLVSTIPRWVLLAFALPFVLHLSMRISLTPLRIGVVLLHAFGFLVLSFGHAAADTWAQGVAVPEIRFIFPWFARLMRSWYNTMPTVASMYAAVLATAWGIAEARERQRRTLRAAHLETLLKSAELAALRAQLQPHFLYNTLNGIAALVSAVQPARAVAAIEQLGELLHASLRDDGREEITVEEEIALAERYLALQTMRFEERLRYEWKIAPSVADCLIPVFLLQPIVENAVVHGLDAGQDSLNVRIDAAELDDSVVITVENDGNPLAVEGSTSNGHGIGITTTRARLETAYGDRASLTLDPRPGGGAVVRIVIPISRSAAATRPIEPVRAIA